MLTTTAQAAQLSATGPVIYHCTNPASGANWDISIDMDRHVADSYPARIGARQITWRDASDAGNYDLDRATGRLTVVRASSTGGYTIFDACVAGR
ncbi:MAG TPA: hypothetical protein VMU56_04180 [Beijerinckiaceae bacterium]|nr:hypothetical protein [Beijerinckiaceae bacterium]HVB89830.1 hypothetical protein [Beijerinckiaceae bacterium]